MEINPFDIIYITPFYFPNGSSKNKYFIPITKYKDNYILATLPTSVDFIPESLPNEHGCINCNITQISAYIFKKDIDITDCCFSFPKNTFINYRRPIRPKINEFTSMYSIEGKDYEIIGKLKESEKKSFIKCLLESKAISRGVRKALEKYCIESKIQLSQ